MGKKNIEPTLDIRIRFLANSATPWELKIGETLPTQFVTKDGLMSHLSTCLPQCLKQLPSKRD